MNSDKRSSPHTLVVNDVSPELNHLAAELAANDDLLKYVRPYANQGRGWERKLARLRGLNSIYGRTFGRRVLPEGFSPADIHETAVMPDVLAAASRQFLGPMGKALDERLRLRIQKQVAATGAEYAGLAETVIAGYGVARPAFERTSGRRVFNYPIAHYRFIHSLVAEVVADESEFTSTPEEWGVPSARLEAQLEAECELADTILIGSSFVRETFMAAGIPASKLFVVPYGANPQHFRPHPESAGPRSSSFHVLFVGQIGQRKGIPYLLRAYRAFHRPDTRLTLVGTLYCEPAGMHPYRELFTHIPHVPQPLLAEIYREADVFVFPTLIEGLGMVVLEAMASGLPVITTRNGPGDVVRDGIDGFLVPIRDTDAIVEKLEYLRANPDRRREMGRNARQRSLEYTWAAYRRGAMAALATRGTDARR